MLDPLIAATLRVSFGTLFGLAAAHKVASFRAFSSVLRNYVKGSPLEGRRSLVVLGVVVIAVELTLLAVCVLPSAGVAAGSLAAAVLSGYAFAMYINLRRGNALLDCGCSWGTHRQPANRFLVLRNLVLAALAASIALPVAARPLDGIDYFSIAAASTFAALLYSGINLLLAVPENRLEA